MGTYPLERIIREWGTGKLSTEQAIGQVLLLIQEMQNMDPKQLEREVYARYEFDLCKVCRDQLLEQFEARRLP